MEISKHYIPTEPFVKHLPAPYHSEQLNYLCLNPVAGKKAEPGFENCSTQLQRS